MSAPSAPPRAASPLPSAKLQVKSRLVLMPIDCAMRRLSTEARPAEAEPKSRDDDGAAEDEKAPVRGEGSAAHDELAAQIFRYGSRLRLRSPDKFGGRHGHEDEADREQHLIELARVVEPPVERSLDHHAESSDDDNGEGESREEGKAGACHQGHRRISPGHGKDAVRKVDEAHEPHGDR